MEEVKRSPPPAKARAQKRKCSEELKHDDTLVRIHSVQPFKIRIKRSRKESLDQDDDLQHLTQKSLQTKTRRSDRIKENGYVHLNFNLRQGPLRNSNCHKSSNSRRDEQQLHHFEHLLGPSAGSLGPGQIASTKPTHSFQEVDTAEKLSTGQLVELEFLQTPEVEIQPRDHISHHKAQPVIQPSATGKFQSPSYYQDCDGIPRDHPHAENTSNASTSSKQSICTNETAKPHSPIIGSKGKNTHKKPRLDDESVVVSSENGLIFDLKSSKEAPSSSTEFHVSQCPAAETKDLGSAALAARSLLHGPDNQLTPQKTAFRGSDIHLSLPEDHLSMQKESPLSKEATAPSESGQDEFTHKAMQKEGSPSEGGVSLFTAPCKSDQDEFEDRSIRVDETRPSAHTWILQSSKPSKEWVLWQGTNIIEAKLQFVFAAVVELTSLKDIRSIEIKLDTPEGQSYTFRTSREDLAHYARMKRFMKNMIAISCRARHSSSMLPNIWITPIEMT